MTAYWRDSDGVVHILDAQYHVMLCTGLYRINPVRNGALVPTCLQCIAAEGRPTSRNGEPGIIEWKTRMPDA